MSRQECIQGFSDSVFWDVDRKQIDLSRHAPYVVQRVLEYGQISDWKLLLAYYGLDEIVSISKNLRSLEPRALAFISTISRTPQEQFRCYNTRQSNPEHYMQKYPDGSLFIAMKSLTYFEDAESNPMPFMFEETDWEDVKMRIREAVIKL